MKHAPIGHQLFSDIIGLNGTGTDLDEELYPTRYPTSPTESLWSGVMTLEMQ
jgi:hypothetical protein